MKIGIDKKKIVLYNINVTSKYDNFKQMRIKYDIIFTAVFASAAKGVLTMGIFDKNIMIEKTDYSDITEGLNRVGYKDAQHFKCSVGKDQVYVVLYHAEGKRKANLASETKISGRVVGKIAQELGLSGYLSNGKNEDKIGNYMVNLEER
jgi:hypothetical protein